MVSYTGVLYAEIHNQRNKRDARSVIVVSNEMSLIRQVSNMVYKKDCFAYHKLTEYSAMCGALKEMRCDGCKFYKTVERCKEEIEKCDRLNEMKGIGNKYAQPRNI